MKKFNITFLLKNDIVKMVTALAAVGVLSGVALVFVYEYSMPKITANIRLATEEGIRNIFPEASDIEETPLADVYMAKRRDGKLLGYAFIAEGNGYQGTIRLIAGIDPSLSVMKGMEVLESQETPGLGAEINSESFRGQFAGLSASEPLEYVKNRKPEKPNQIEAITGATISSRAVVNILTGKIEELRKKI